jgi:hypothetical protein
MKGNIYVRGKCQCGGTFIYIEKRNGCYCEKCDKIATKIGMSVSDVKFNADLAMISLELKGS